MKPRVMFLVVFTALVGMVAAPGSMHPVLAIAALICIAAGAGAVRRAQHVVRRRYRRGHGPHRRASDPARAGDARPRRALSASVLALGLGGLSRADGQLARRSAARASPSASMFSSTRCGSSGATPQNIVIGGAAGAVPPMIGWAAATGTHKPRTLRPVPHHLLLDAAAFLGARLPQDARLCAGRRADAAGGAVARTRPGCRSSSTA